MSKLEKLAQAIQIRNHIPTILNSRENFTKEKKLELNSVIRKVDKFVVDFAIEAMKELESTETNNVISEQFSQAAREIELTTNSVKEPTVKQDEPKETKEQKLAPETLIETAEVPKTKKRGPKQKIEALEASAHLQSVTSGPNKPETLEEVQSSQKKAAFRRK